jgi:hypothetical protein
LPDHAGTARKHVVGAGDADHAVARAPRADPYGPAAGGCARAGSETRNREVTARRQAGLASGVGFLLQAKDAGSGRG